MKWYKKQLDALLKKQSKKLATTKPTEALRAKKNKPKKVIHAGLEKRSRNKTDSIS